MKKKFLIGGGITALVAVIAVIAVFAQGGNYFKGSVGVLGDPVSTVVFGDSDSNDYVDMHGYTSGPNFYVKETYSGYDCDYFPPLGTKDCPFKTIQDAVFAMVSSGGNDYTIYVAEGTYHGVNLSGFTLNLKGGYNSNFSGNTWNTTIDGPITYADVSGEISGLRFSVKDGSHNALQVVNHNENKRMEIFNNTFTGGFTEKDMVLLNGNNIHFRNNSFNYAKSRESVLNALGRTLVKDNYFNKSIAGGNTEAIIKTTYGYIFNNLVINSLSGTSNAIYSEGGDSVIANNTIANNPGITEFGLKIGETAKAVNNLIVNNGGQSIYAGEFADVTNNGIDNSSIKTDLLHIGNFICDADFVSTNSVNRNDYKLGENNTCKDKGIAVANVTEDSFGTSRPQGSAYDVGFYEIPVQFVMNLKPLTAVPLTITVCGDGTVDSNEECDDGNTTGGDGCDSDCKNEAVQVEDVCSNLEGVQAEVPSGYIAVSGICSPEGDPLVDPVQPEEVECGDWTDVSSSDQEYDMWMYLCEKGIVKGNTDGTLRPESKLNRAELLALAFRASEYENIYNVSENASDCFPDVDNEWFAKYVCTAKNKGFIKGYDDGKARPERDVILAEGLKIFLGALDEPFDVSDSDCWYCDMVDESGDDDYLPYSFSDPKQVGPTELTRRKTFNMLYRIMIYR